LVVEKLKSMVVEMSPNCSFKIFGSFATGLSLPNSDIDIVVNNTDQPTIPFLRALQDKIIQMDIAYTVELIEKANVPLVK